MLLEPAAISAASTPPLDALVPTKMIYDLCRLDSNRRKQHDPPLPPVVQSNNVNMILSSAFFLKNIFQKGNPGWNMLHDLKQHIVFVK